VSADIAAFFHQQRPGSALSAADERPLARAFFALVPPPALQQALAQLAGDVAIEARGRAVRADNVHLTLAFVGSWPLARLDSLLDVGERCRCARMRVELDTLGGFRRAGVAWIGTAKPPAALIDWAAALSAALVAAGVPMDARPFHPHVTLARRCRGPYRHGAIEPYRWHLDAIALMQSQTYAEGPRYSTLRRWALPG
jgi:2'-5' RNA ligase